MPGRGHWQTTESVLLLNDFRSSKLLLKVPLYFKFYTVYNISRTWQSDWLVGIKFGLFLWKWHFVETVWCRQSKTLLPQSLNPFSSCTPTLTNFRIQVKCRWGYLSLNWLIVVCGAACRTVIVCHRWCICFCWGWFEDAEVQKRKFVQKRKGIAMIRVND